MTTFIETLNHSGDQFLKFAWPMLWQSSLLIAIIFVLEFALRRKVPAAIRYALWLMVLVKLLLPPSLALPTSPSWWIHPSVPPPVKAPPVSFTVSYGEQMAPDFPLPPSPAIPPPKAPAMSFAAWTLAASGVVSAGLLAWLLVRWRQINQRVRRANTSEKLIPVLDEARRLTQLRPGIRLKLTEDSMSPAVCGLFRPVILLPRSLVEKLSAGQLRAVLLHETIHLRRGDVWMNCAQALLQIVYWWHPLLWLANARIRRVREEAVDDAVMLALRDDAEIYAPTLLEVAKLAFNRPLASLGLVGILESRSALRQRIERLVNFNAPKKAGLTIVSILGILAFSAVALPMGQAPENKNLPPTSDTTISVHQIYVTADGRFRLEPGGTNNLDLAGVRSWIGSIKKDSSDATVQIHADAAAQYQAIVPLVDLCKELGIERIQLKTESAGDPQQLNTRAFKLPPVATSAAGKGVSKIDFSNTNLTTAEVKTFLNAIGINLNGPGRSISFNAGLSLLSVKATEAELGQVERFVQPLNQLASAESLAGPEPVTPAEQGTDRINRMFVPGRMDIPITTTNATESAMLVQDGKLLYEMGKFDDAEAKLKAALARSPTNQAAHYYLDLVEQARQAPKAQGPKINYPDSNNSPTNSNPQATNLEMRVFKVGPNTFAAGLRDTPGLQTNNVAAMAQRLFSKLGVDLTAAGRSIVFHEPSGRLFVKATPSELDTVERVIQTLNQAPPQIHIKARFIEVEQANNATLGFDWYLGFFTNGPVVANGRNPPSLAVPVSAANSLGSYPGNTTANVIAGSAGDQSPTQGLGNASPARATITGILTDPNFRVVLHTLKQRAGVETLAEPECVTTSGRQTQMRATDIQTVPTGINPLALKPPGVSSNELFLTEQVVCGPIFDVVPYVLADGYTINLTATAFVTEFLGYDKPTNSVTAYINGKKQTVPVPQPKFRTQKISTVANLWDNQTLVLGGSVTSAVQTTKNKVPLLGDMPLVGGLFRSQTENSVKKQLMVFVTATIVDQAGNRVHSDDGLPFNPNTIPTQPQTSSPSR